jgi:hypothetical protein
MSRECPKRPQVRAESAGTIRILRSPAQERWGLRREDAPRFADGRRTKETAPPGTRRVRPPEHPPGIPVELGFDRDGAQKLH